MKRIRTQSEIKTHGVIKHRVPELMKEAGVNSMDLARYGLAINTAYKYGRGEQDGSITFDVISTLCDFFTERLGRNISIGDIFYNVPNEDKVS